MLLGAVALNGVLCLALDSVNGDDKRGESGLSSHNTMTAQQRHLQEWEGSHLTLLLDHHSQHAE